MPRYRISSPHQNSSGAHVGLERCRTTLAQARQPTERFIALARTANSHANLYGFSLQTQLRDTCAAILRCDSALESLWLSTRKPNYDCLGGTSGQAIPLHERHNITWLITVYTTVCSKGTQHFPLTQLATNSWFQRHQKTETKTPNSFWGNCPTAQIGEWSVQKMLLRRNEHTPSH